MKPVLTAALLAAVVLPAPLASGGVAPARVQVSATEFRLTLSRTVLRAGPAIVELVDFGQDDHDLALRRVGGTRTYRAGVVHPGGRTEIEARLGPGRYVLWCTLADHRARGMTAVVRVR